MRYVILCLTENQTFCIAFEPEDPLRAFFLEFKFDWAFLFAYERQLRAAGGKGATGFSEKKSLFACKNRASRIFLTTYLRRVHSKCYSMP